MNEWAEKPGPYQTDLLASCIVVLTCSTVVPSQERAPPASLDPRKKGDCCSLSEKVGSLERRMILNK